MVANAYSSWPTATSSMTTGAGSEGREGGLNLQTAVSAWPTPTGQDSSASGAQGYSSPNHHAGVTLTDAAQRNWQAPTTGGNKNRGGDRSEEMLLQGQAQQVTNWATPMASDDGYKVTEASHQNSLIKQSARFSGPRDQTTPMDGDESSASAPTSRLRLNPRFVEWLMGWPDGYLAPTSSTFLATE